MNIDGKGIIIVDVNGTINHIVYKNNEELLEMIEKFFTKQKLDKITIVDCEDKKIHWIDDYVDYGNLRKEII